MVVLLLKNAVHFIHLLTTSSCLDKVIVSYDKQPTELLFFFV